MCSFGLILRCSDGWVVFALVFHSHCRASSKASCGRGRASWRFSMLGSCGAKAVAPLHKHVACVKKGREGLVGFRAASQKRGKTPPKREALVLSLRLSFEPTPKKSVTFPSSNAPTELPPETPAQHHVSWEPARTQTQHFKAHQNRAPQSQFKSTRRATRSVYNTPTISSTCSKEVAYATNAMGAKA